MKKQKKHSFHHSDPELIKERPAIKNSETAPKKEVSYAESDLKRTAILIGGFVVGLVALYFIQTKTGLLAPVLKIFGI
jgi:hypothetical protein